MMSESGRLRRTGWIVLAAGIVAAAIFYAVEPTPDAVTSDLSTLRYERAQERELGMMMGKSGLLLFDLQQALERPDVQALLIAAGGGLFSLYFFRAAWVLDEERRDAQRRS